MNKMGGGELCAAVTEQRTTDFSCTYYLLREKKQLPATSYSPSIHKAKSTSYSGPDDCFAHYPVLWIASNTTLVQTCHFSPLQEYTPHSLGEVKAGNGDTRLGYRYHIFVMDGAEVCN